MNAKSWLRSLLLVGLVTAMPQTYAQDWERTPEGRPLAVTPNARQREMINRKLAPSYQKLRDARRDLDATRDKIFSDAREHQRQYDASLKILRRTQPVRSGFTAAPSSEIARWDRAYNETMAWHRSQVASLKRRWQNTVKDSRAIDEMASDLDQARSQLLRGNFNDLGN